MGDVLLHRTQRTVPPDQVGDHPSTVCEEQATSTGKCWYQHSYACPETVEDMSYFSTLSRLPSYSHLFKSASSSPILSHVPKWMSY